MPVRRRAWIVVTSLFVVLGGFAGFAPGARAAGTSTISGAAFQDVDRDGVRDAGEAPFVDHVIYLMSESGSLLQAAGTDASGRYTFTGLSDGRYQVELAPRSWDTVKVNWAPTTLPSLTPTVTVQLASASTINFGWRPIVRSTDQSQPISMFVGPSGLRAESYNDVVTAKQLHDSIVSGSLVGAEAASVQVLFDLTPNNYCSSSFDGGPGSYNSHAATVYVSWLAWLDGGDQVLHHEYGHAWSNHYSYLAQQDPSLAGYLTARGLAGDPRLDTSHAWDRRELIAEDFRQLFGSSTARAGAQENQEIPVASVVAGLADYLRGPFRSSTGGGTTEPAPSPSPSPSPAPVVTGLSVNPNPVKSSGTVSLALNTAASLTVRILDSKGTVVRTLLDGAAQVDGAVSVRWDRLNDQGRKVRGGQYTVHARAAAPEHPEATASLTFSVG